MCDVLSLKSYSRFVTDYLVKLLEVHGDSIGKRGNVLEAARLKNAFKSIYKTSHGLNKELKDKLASQFPKLRSLTSIEDHETFPHFLRLLAEVDEADKRAEDEAMSVLVESLAENRAAFGHWHQMYAAFLPASSRLLRRLDEKWGELPKSLRRDAEFKATLEAFEEHNAGLKPNKEGLNVASTAIEVSLLHFLIRLKHKKHL